MTAPKLRLVSFDDVLDEFFEMAVRLGVVPPWVQP